MFIILKLTQLKVFSQSLLNDNKLQFIVSLCMFIDYPKNMTGYIWVPVLQCLLGFFWGKTKGSWFPFSLLSSVYRVTLFKRSWITLCGYWNPYSGVHSQLTPMISLLTRILSPSLTPSLNSEPPGFPDILLSFCFMVFGMTGPSDWQHLLTVTCAFNYIYVTSFLESHLFLENLLLCPHYRAK